MPTPALDHHRHHQADNPKTSPLGNRRGCPDLARFSLDLTRARAESERAVRTTAYPSPPMSGSPPLPLKPTHEAGDCIQGSYQSTSYDAYPGPSNSSPAAPSSTPYRPESRAQHLPQHPHHHHHHSAPYQHPHAPQHLLQHQHQHQHQQQSRPLQAPLTSTSLPLHLASSALSRSYPPEHPSERLTYRPYDRPDDGSSSRAMPPLPPFAQHQPQLPGPAMSAYPPYLPPLPGPAQMRQGYPGSPRPPPPAQAPSPSSPTPGGSEGNQPFPSPKSQRKTKGHVASACVPCKRAHLRCDAQRPCVRCLGTGKEEACVDVQHKKRGRPRIREEKDLRYELSGRGPPLGPDSHSIERPMHTAPPRPSRALAVMGSGYGLPRRHGLDPSHRTLRRLPADSMAPRYIDRGSASDANAYPAPLSNRAPEPAAFLTTDLEIARVSETFLDAIGRPNVNGLRLLDVVVHQEREKVLSLQQQMQTERERKEPHYLPPIFVRTDEDRVLQSLGFAAEDLSRFSLEWHDYLTFVSYDGLQRTFPVHLGLAKQDSIYFIVLVLSIAVRPLSHPTPPPHSQDVPYSYSPPHHPSRIPQEQSTQRRPEHQHSQQQLYSHPNTSGTFDNSHTRGQSDTSYLPPRPPGPPGRSRTPAVLPMLSPGGLSSYAALSGQSEYPFRPSSYQTQTPRSELPPGVRPHLQGPQPGIGYQLPPIRSREEARRPADYPQSRVDIGGLIDRSDPSR